MKINLYNPNSFAILTYVFILSGSTWAYGGLGEGDDPSADPSSQVAPLSTGAPTEPETEDAPPPIHQGVVDNIAPPPPGPIAGQTLDDYRAIIQSGDHPKLHECIAYMLDNHRPEDRALAHKLLRIRLENQPYDAQDIAIIKFLRESIWPDNQILGIELQQKTTPITFAPDLQERIGGFNQEAIKAAVSDPAMKHELTHDDSPDTLCRHAIQYAMNLVFENVFVQKPHIVLQAHIGLRPKSFVPTETAKVQPITNAEIESMLTTFYAVFSPHLVIEVMSEFIQHDGDMRTIASYETATEEHKPRIAARIASIKKRRPITVANLEQWLIDHKEPYQTNEDVRKFYGIQPNYISLTGLERLLERWGYKKKDVLTGITEYYSLEMHSKSVERLERYGH